MQGLTFFATAMVLFAAMIFGQSPTTPPSDQSNSSQSSAQSQNQTNSDTGKHPSRDANGSRMHDRRPENSPPDSTVRDQQPSTTSTTGASGQSNTQPSTSTMGTSGRTPAAHEPSTTAPPSDQQPNSSASPSSPQPQAYLMQTPGARAAATHTPDPGTCMNPAALQAAESGNQPRPGPPCD